MGVVTALAIGAGVAAVAGTVQAISANKKEKEAREEQGLLNASIADQEKALQKIGNPYSNLGVAAKAAEFQAEQGATALAQAALTSKQGISADLQRQEASNQKMYAGGEDTRFLRQEGRDMTKLDRTQAQLDQARQTEQAMYGQKMAAVGNIASSVTGLAGNVAGLPT